jgi:signal transduction histidine kinase
MTSNLLVVPPVATPGSTVVVRADTIGRIPLRRSDADTAAQERFVWTLAHELRQPISVISSAVAMIRLSSPSEATTHAIEIVGRQLQQISRMVEDLVDAARLARGKVSLQCVRLDLRQVINEAAADVAVPLAERSLVLDVECGRTAMWVRADAERLHQVFSNLLRNAIKCTKPGGRIALSLEDGPTAITARVLDTGCGIAAPALARIFDLFVQVEPAAGLGIGLSVVREIVELHSGQISARSQGLGKGSEFIVTLPRCTSDIAELSRRSGAERTSIWN